MVERLTAEHMTTDDRQDGLLLHAVCHKPLNQGVNESCLWGDYFFLEAMLRLETRHQVLWWAPADVSDPEAESD